MVPGAGVEPARCCHRGILSPLRLPISPPGHIVRVDLYDQVWRLNPESNRGTRLCRPLHHHSAIQPKCFANPDLILLLKLKTPDVPGFLWILWSGKRDSNSRPQPWQGCALPLSYSRLIKWRHFIGCSRSVKDECEKFYFYFVA